MPLPHDAYGQNCPDLKIMGKGTKIYSHKPVMEEEISQFLLTDPDGLYLDATVGLGGHSSRILSFLKNGKLLGLDQDSDALSYAEKKLAPFKEKFSLIQANFKETGAILKTRNFFPLTGALFDLGVSSLQLDNPLKGFSFREDGPLDMRFSRENPLTAAIIVNRWPEDQISRILIEYGEEPRAQKIARQIVQERKKNPIETTSALASLISRVGFHGKTHPATRSFMALRIAVNGELDNIEPGIRGALSHLKIGGRIAAITFHSLEDRLVKNLFQSFSSEGKTRFVGPKQVPPNEEEIQNNPRARSAKLRVMEKINEK